MIYIASWETESCDRGVAGYWLKKPTEGQLTAYFKKHFPDEFEQGYRLITWELHTLEVEKLPRATKLVPST